MTTVTRKQREIARREQLILDVARKMLLERGYLGLSMDRIADATEYSKGTVYQHFSSKEDLLGALVLGTLAIRTDMFRRATSFQGNTRERLTAVGVADEVFVRLYPDHFRIEQIAGVESIADKITPERQEAIDRLDDALMESLKALVEEAISKGDVTLPEETPRGQVLFGLWSLAVGAHTIEGSEKDCCRLDIADPGGALWSNYQILLDGYGWKPLSTEWDYEVSVDRIRREVFSDECSRFDP
jgi:AcrR family transcriptional regulator